MLSRSSPRGASPPGSTACARSSRSSSAPGRRTAAAGIDLTKQDLAVWRTLIVPGWLAPAFALSALSRLAAHGRVADESDSCVAVPLFVAVHTAVLGYALSFKTGEQNVGSFVVWFVIAFVFSITVVAAASSIVTALTSYAARFEIWLAVRFWGGGHTAPPGALAPVLPVVSRVGNSLTIELAPGPAARRVKLDELILDVDRFGELVAAEVLGLVRQAGPGVLKGWSRNGSRTASYLAYDETCDAFSLRVRYPRVVQLPCETVCVEGVVELDEEGALLRFVADMESEQKPLDPNEFP